MDDRGDCGIEEALASSVVFTDEVEDADPGAGADAREAMAQRLMGDERVMAVLAAMISDPSTFKDPGAAAEAGIEKIRALAVGRLLTAEAFEDVEGALGRHLAEMFF